MFIELKMYLVWYIDSVGGTPILEGVRELPRD